MQLATTFLAFEAISYQSKLPTMNKKNSDSSKVSARISRGRVNGDANLMSCTGKGGPVRPPTTHARKSTTTQPTGITDVQTMKEVILSCKDIRENEKFSSMKGLLRNDNYNKVMIFSVLLFDSLNHDFNQYF